MVSSSASGHRLRRAGAAAVGIACVLGAVTALGPAAAQAADGPATPSARTPGQARLVTLPTGDHVRVSGTGAQARADLLATPGHRAAAVTSRVDGRAMVVPTDQVGRISSLASFQVSGDDAPTATPRYAMSLLDIKALDHEGVPARAAEVLVVNTDDPARATWDGLMTGGDARIEVPTGNYGVAVGIFDTDAKGDSTETDLLTATDVSVPAAGATVSLDGRAAHQLAFQTSRPSVFDAAAVGWDRGTAGHLQELSVGAAAGTRFYIGAAGPAAHGVLRYTVVGRQLSPASLGTPYSYAIALPDGDRIPATATYPIADSSLATVDSSYPTDQPHQDLQLADGWLEPTAGDAPALPDLPDVTVHAPALDRRYISAPSSLRYDGLMLPLVASAGFLEGELERDTRFAPGQHASLAWRAGLTVPAPSTYDGPCFLCRQGNTIHGLDVMDTDNAGDVGQWSDGPTTITEDGKQIYQGNTLGTIFDQALPAANHHYVYTLDTTHPTATTQLAQHSRISWGFDSAQTASSMPVPILYGQTSLTEDAHDSVEPGANTITVNLQHQPHATDAAVRGATVSISYDDGKDWIMAAVSLGAHQVRGTWTVPATQPTGYLAVRLHAVDAAGSTLDETVYHAALVNAPNGIATSGDTTPPPTGTRAACPAAAAGHARCYALSTAARWQPSKAALPDGYGPADLRSAYKLPGSGGARVTVAIVDAHDDPTAEADLAVYRSTYGLPACTTANGCFTKLNEHGKTSPLPPYVTDDDWSDEVSLDLDMVSAICPACHIDLVEANDSDTASLGTAERAATSSGAVAVSNSWGGDEGSGDAPWNSAFQHPGVAITASSGDSGFREASWPASLPTVIAVGGTSLTKSSTAARGWTETAWKGAGSGCSAYQAKPSWQHDPHCGMRTIADISAVADPATGLAVYVQGSWGVFGGTSASSPIIAAMIALAGNSAELTSARYIYAHSSKLFDVTSGANVNWNCGGDYLCTAGPGYDGPTGLGTPNGLGGL
ncbi:MAG TPA: S53 family peptidase [Pseudonocardiaceae bacterium]|nr:S53 family peptidase [Pseudonocardiaceae bacterium]